MTEKQLEEKLVKATEKRGGKAFKFTSCGSAGVPDRLILLPGGDMGFVEVKKPGKGKLSKLQHLQLSRIEDLHFKCYVLDDPEGIELILDDMKKDYYWTSVNVAPYTYRERRRNERNRNKV